MGTVLPRFLGFQTVRAIITIQLRLLCLCSVMVLPGHFAGDFSDARSVATAEELPKKKLLIAPDSSPISQFP